MSYRTRPSWTGFFKDPDRINHCALQDPEREFFDGWYIHNRYAFLLWWSEFHLIQARQLKKCCLYQLFVFHQIHTVRLNYLASDSCQISTNTRTHPIHHHSFTFTYILHFCQFESQSSPCWLHSTCYSHMLPAFPGLHGFSHTVYVSVLSVPVPVIFHFLTSRGRIAKSLFTCCGITQPMMKLLLSFLTKT